MTKIRKPPRWSEEALENLMRRVAAGVEARVKAARERLAADPVARARVIEVIGRNGFTLDEDLQVVPLESEHSQPL